jgi:hypothetical protein
VNHVYSLDIQEMKEGSIYVVIYIIYAKTTYIGTYRTPPTSLVNLRPEDQKCSGDKTPNIL